VTDQPHEVSWLVIEKGWKVVSADGEEVGWVDEIVGDSGKDIFNGLSISEGVLKGKRYVAAEHVALIREGSVELDVPAAEIEHLEGYGEAPPSEEIRPD
jgi:hypothetical protein